jgi:hypothetical protein
MTVELVEVEPNKWRVKRTPQNFARSEHPIPYVISDSMFYESKSTFRAVGRALGLVEVGTEKLTPKPKGTNHADKSHKEGRRRALEKALAIVKGV